MKWSWSLDSFRPCDRRERSSGCMPSCTFFLGPPKHTAEVCPQRRQKSSTLARVTMSQPTWLCPLLHLPPAPALPSQGGNSSPLASTFCLQPETCQQPLGGANTSVWLKRSIAADSYVFSALDAEVPWKPREYKQSWMQEPPGCRLRLLTPSPVPARLNSLLSQGRTEGSQARRFSTAFPAEGSRAWHTDPFQSPHGSNPIHKPRRGQRARDLGLRE